MEYQKINTIFKRDERNLIMENELSQPEFEYLYDNLWECTEKIDGTNIRIELSASVSENDIPSWKMEIKGKTDAAIIPKNLFNRLIDIFGKIDWNTVFPDIKENTDITIYGEGYGKGIQKGGGNYIRNGNDFILFDVKVGNWWLNRKNIESIASKLNVKIVPFIGLMTLGEAIEYVRKGFKSNISENKEYIAEGLVLKVPCGMLGRNGKRIITKLKTQDFRKKEQALNTKNVHTDTDMKKKIYISIPITGHKIEEVKNKLESVRETLKTQYGEDKVELITPFDVGKNTFDKPYEYYLSRDLEVILKCDAVFFCKGWETSKGCRLEMSAVEIYGKNKLFETEIVAPFTGRYITDWNHSDSKIHDILEDRVENDGWKITDHTVETLISEMNQYSNMVKSYPSMAMELLEKEDPKRKCRTYTNYKDGHDCIYEDIMVIELF